MIPKVIDNFISDKELSFILDDVRHCNWNTQVSNAGDLISFFFFELKNVFYTERLLSRIENELGHEVELERVYFNGQYNGREGCLHTDDCDFTALIYVSEYHPDWGGFTQIVHSATDQTIVPPVQKRLLIMDGMEYHKGYSYVYQTNPMRVTLAFKLNLK